MTTMNSDEQVPNTTKTNEIANTDKNEKTKLEAFIRMTH